MNASVANFFIFFGGRVLHYPIRKDKADISIDIQVYVEKWKLYKQYV